MADKLCPLLNDSCVEHQCRFWIHVVGQNPQTGVQEDKFDCAIAWMPILMIENSNEQRKTAASVQSFRNEMVKMQGMMLLEARGRQGIENGNAT